MLLARWGSALATISSAYHIFTSALLNLQSSFFSSTTSLPPSLTAKRSDFLFSQLSCLSQPVTSAGPPFSSSPPLLPPPRTTASDIAASPSPLSDQQEIHPTETRQLNPIQAFRIQPTKPNNQTTPHKRNPPHPFAKILPSLNQHLPKLSPIFCPSIITARHVNSYKYLWRCATQEKAKQHSRSNRP